MTEREIFFNAVEIETAEARVAYVQEACGTDVNLRREVEQLLGEHFSNDSLLAGPILEQQQGADHESPIPGVPPQMIGRYRLLERIGEGGFGEVWMAEQREPVKRRVALKVIKPGMDSRQGVARFEAERQALALMDDPHIAKILDAGTTEAGEGVAPGRPYFVMELVKGTPITEYCNQNELPTVERLKLFILVCQAVQHAHQKGIIHRDLKPSNILVTLHDGAPVPKVIDFGIAKATHRELTEKTVFTQFHQFIGTPAYISPEQAEMRGLDIDTRADIYSLGVLLYELLVGQTPFDPTVMLRGGLDALRKVICEVVPPRPSTRLTRTLAAAEVAAPKTSGGLCSPTQEEIAARARRRLRLKHQIALVRGDLDWIVMKCLEKDRTRRYETANGLAMDLRRYLANEPVVARPPTAIYRFGKACRRNKVAVVAAGLVTCVLALGIGAVILVQHRANLDFRQRLYLSEVSRAGVSWQSGQSSKVHQLLERCPTDLRHWEWDFLRQQADRWQAKVFLATTNLIGAALSADGRLAAVAANGAVQIHEFPSGKWLREIPFVPAWHSPFAVSPRDERLATLAGPEGALMIWDMRTGERLVTANHGARADALSWSADGRLVASGGDDKAIRIWDATTGEEARAFATTARVTAVAFSPDGRALAVGTTEPDAQLLSSSTGAVLRTLRIQGRNVRWLKFNSDGSKLAMSNLTYGGYGQENRVWNLDQEGSIDLTMRSSALSFAFEPDSRQLYVADEVGMIRLWDLDRRVEVERFSAHVGAVHSMQLLPDGRIFSAGNDGSVKVWEAGNSCVVELRGYPNSLRTLAFSPDGQWLIAAGVDRRVVVWDLPGTRLAGIYTNHLTGTPAVAVSGDGRVASASGDAIVGVWNPATYNTHWTRSLAPAADAFWLAFSPDNRRLYAASRLDTITALDAATGERLFAISGFENVIDGLAVSPDSRLLAICHKTRLSVWLADGSRELWHVPANPQRCAAFSPDGKWIATGDQDGSVSLWETAAAGRVHRTLQGHTAAVSGVSFHPDGRRLASSSFDGRVKVWDWRVGADLLTLPPPSGGLVWQVAFSPDGKTIAAAGGDGTVTLWRTF